MDRVEQLAWDAEIAVAVLGNPRTGEFSLIDLDHDMPMSEAARESARQRGFEFCGVVGVKNGIADAMCDPVAGALGILCAAVMPFVRRYAAKLGPKSDGADWLERLHALPDPRES